LANQRKKKTALMERRRKVSTWRPLFFILEGKKPKYSHGFRATQIGMWEIVVMFV